MEITPNLSLPYILPSQAQKHVTHNEALRMLDALVQLSVLSRHLTMPPELVDDGDRYIVATGATGAWEGHDSRVAAWQDGSWSFLDPRPGWLCFIAAEDMPVFWNGSAWQDMAAMLTALQNLSHLGIGTTADETNPFAAKLNKALWTSLSTGEGGNGDLRYTLNKENAGNVLSLLMQSNWSGRAEIGLVGDDDLSVKVSPNGTTWKEAMRIGRNSGKVSFPLTNLLSDFAVSLLPDSGRFAGTIAKDNLATAFTFPSYLTLLNGTTAANGGKFVHDNNDYGGTRGSLPAMIRHLTDMIRAPANRRYGVEFFAAELTMGTGTLYPVTHEGVPYYYSMQLSFGPRAPAMTFHTYLRALDAPIVFARFSGQTIIKNGTPHGSYVVIEPGEGWVSLTVQDQIPPYTSNGYQPVPLNIHARQAGNRYLMACPALMGGLTGVDDNIGVIAGINRWLP